MRDADRLLRWVLAGAGLSYLLFFVVPVFLGPSRTMQIFEYVPRATPVGSDLTVIRGYSEAWFLRGQSPYLGVDPVEFRAAYPPIATVLLGPLIALDHARSTVLVIALTLAGYVLIGWLIPAWTRGGPSPALTLVFVSGLGSYGLAFELERGQFNLIAVGCSLLGVFLFHRHPRYRIAAYALVTAGAQLKLYPAIFALMLVDQRRRVPANLGRLAALGAVNAALLLALGPRVFGDFLTVLADQAAHPYTWIGNHSIQSFVTLVATRGVDTRGFGSLAWVAAHRGAVATAGHALVLGCLAALLVAAYRWRRAGLDRPLLLGCAIAALLIPSVSHDYKLPILAGPLAMLLDDVGPTDGGSGPRRWALAPLGCVLGAAYASTLFSYTNKPFVVANNVPALVVMLAATTAWAFVTLPERPAR